MGRERELGELKQFFEAHQNYTGSPAYILISGRLGSGTSHLAEAFLSQLDSVSIYRLGTSGSIRNRLMSLLNYEATSEVSDAILLREAIKQLDKKALIFIDDLSDFDGLSTLAQLKNAIILIATNHTDLDPFFHGKESLGVELNGMDESEISSVVDSIYLTDSSRNRQTVKRILKEGGHFLPALIKEFCAYAKSVEEGLGKNGAHKRFEAALEQYYESYDSELKGALASATWSH